MEMIITITTTETDTPKGKVNRKLLNNQNVTIANGVIVEMQRYPLEIVEELLTVLAKRTRQI